MIMFHDGMAAYHDEYYEWSIINENGDIIANGLQRVEPFHEGYARVWTDGGFGFIDESGNMVFETLCEYASDVNEGMALIRADEGAYFLKFLNAKVDKVAAESQAIILNKETAKTKVEASMPTQYKALDFMGKTFSEIEVMLGVKLLEYPSIRYGGGTEYYYGSLDADYFWFGFPYDSRSPEGIMPDTKITVVGAGWTWPVTDEVSAGKTIAEMFGGLTLDSCSGDPEASFSYTKDLPLPPYFMRITSSDNVIADYIEIWDKEF